MSQAKRDKIERTWGAKLTDNFGMTEAGMMGAEDVPGAGFRIWTDLYYIEVLDPKTARAGEGGRGRHAGGDRAADQQRHAVPALELGRPRHLQRG